jgi:hypothetical protein
MRQFVNTTLVKRNDYFGRGLIFIGLTFVVGGFLYSFEDPDAFVELSIVLVAGVVLSQAGLMIYSRWGNKPRDYEVFGSELRGFSDHHLLIHYALDANHAFVCPGGIYNFIPVRDPGEVTIQDGSPVITTPPEGLFKRSKRIKLSRRASAGYKEAARHSKKVGQVLEVQDPITVQPIMVFLADNVTLADDIDHPLAVHIKQLKGVLKKLCKSDRALTHEQIDSLVEHIT